MKDFVRPKPGEKIPLSYYDDIPSTTKPRFNERDLVPATQVQPVSISKGWADVVSTGAKGAGQALQQQQQRATQLAQIKEQKRRRLAEMLAKSLKRDSSLSQLGIEHGDEGADYQSQAIQDVARGFADTFRRG